MILGKPSKIKNVSIFFFFGGGLTFLAPTRSSGSYFVCLCVPFVNSELFLHAVSWLSLDSLSAVSQLSLSCLSDVFQLSFSCLSAVSQLSLSCLSAVYELSSKRKSSYPSKLSLCALGRPLIPLLSLHCVAVGAFSSLPRRIGCQCHPSTSDWSV